MGGRRACLTGSETDSIRGLASPTGLSQSIDPLPPASLEHDPGACLPRSRKRIGFGRSSRYARQRDIRADHRVDERWDGALDHRLGDDEVEGWSLHSRADDVPTVLDNPEPMDGVDVGVIPKRPCESSMRLCLASSASRRGLATLRNEAGSSIRRTFIEEW